MSQDYQFSPFPITFPDTARLSIYHTVFLTFCQYRISWNLAGAIRFAIAPYVAQRKRIDEEMKAREAARRAEKPLPAPEPVAVTRTHAPARRNGPSVRGL